MTLNEIINWATENNVDFDKLVLIPHDGATDIQKLETSMRASTNTLGLVIRIF